MVSVSLLHPFILLLLSFSLGGALASPVPDETNTNAYRLARGLPLKKPLNPFNATRTAAKRQQPSGAPQTGNFVVTYNNPTKRKRSGSIYLAPKGANSIFSITGDPAQAILVKTPGTGAFSNSKIQAYDPTAGEWQYMRASKFGDAQSGFDVSLLGSNEVGTTFRQSASNVLGYDYVASDTDYNFSPQLYVGTYGSRTVVVGANSPTDLSDLSITNAEPVTLTFAPETEVNPCGRKRAC
ncbi:hypothetical protein V865_001240 [Kwoniella europaea PYCC6329]|uniref:Peptidase A1 domain-containing protein n=1 Tax=Kwoniella europaea PYCC6329 TaxID=1423913 RepID=A0AAX4KBD1_9TREE